MIISRAAEVERTENGGRFDVVASLLFPDMSRKRIKAIIDAGGAYLNRKRVVLARTITKTGDRVELFWEDLGSPNSVAPSRGETWTKLVEDVRSNIVFDHEGFVVVNKPAGLASQATLVSSRDTVIYALEEVDSNRFRASELCLVHRLDKDTSGLLLVAKDKKWQAVLEALFRERQVNKEYCAICFAIPKNKSGVISYPLAPDPSRKNAWQPVYGKRPSGQGKCLEAQTRFEVAEDFARSDAALVHCFPATGRTHQIRVHLMAIGCPIIGDKTYARNVSGHVLDRLALRHMLHARRLSFTLPNGAQFAFEAPLPPDFVACLEEIRQRELA